MGIFNRLGSKARKLNQWASLTDWAALETQELRVKEHVQALVHLNAQERERRECDRAEKDYAAQWELPQEAVVHRKKFSTHNIESINNCSRA